MRIYVGDSNKESSNLFRVDNAHVPANQLTRGGSNPGWTKLSSNEEGTSGFSSYNFCGGQCSYDMVVYSPPGAPDTVYIGGAMQYEEIFTQNPPSNGRTVQRSVDAGVQFTDMTRDTQDPPLGMHPDQHAMAAVPGASDVLFFGSDGGLIRNDGGFSNKSDDCLSRGLSPLQLKDCQGWLAQIPKTLLSLNKGLATLQFQSVSINVQNSRNDLLGGTQDNGTWAFNGVDGSWFETVGGDGGQSGIDVLNPDIRMHTYYGPNPDVNFRGNDPLGWNYIGDPLGSSKEEASFYVPLINDPLISRSQHWFTGLEHVWRTRKSGGDPSYLEQHCNEISGDFAPTAVCGDWAPLGTEKLTGEEYGFDKLGQFIVALARAKGDQNTLWAGTRLGRLFITKNLDAEDAAVSFQRIDLEPIANMPTPTRFISGIAVDPANSNHAYISYSGYNAYARAAYTAIGHVFEVYYNPDSNTAYWKDLSHNLGDQPITGLVFDNIKGDLYAATDFGVLRLSREKSKWQSVSGNLPSVAVYGLTIDTSSRLLYAATHGRGIWRLAIR